MEYLRGLSLSELVHRDGPLPPGRVIYIFRQVCAGLAEAHAKGLVHRDLKPANIFIAMRGGEADVAKVLDFGLVKLTRDPAAAELSSEMTVSGTPMYMAPEQAVGDRSLDARADIYALGAMMYYALTGQPPFSGETPFAIMMAHARDPVVPPSQIHPGVPPDLEQVVLRCLAKKPADRFPNVRALGDALAACASASDWGPNRADAWWAAESIDAGEPTRSNSRRVRPWPDRSTSNDPRVGGSPSSQPRLPRPPFVSETNPFSVFCARIDGVRPGDRVPNREVLVTFRPFAHFAHPTARSDGASLPRGQCVPTSRMSAFIGLIELS